MNWYKLAKEKEKKKRNRNVLPVDEDMGIGVFDVSEIGIGDVGIGDSGIGGDGGVSIASEYDESELSKGIEVEMEHTDDKEEAKKIAIDHLKEDPNYYSKLEKCMADRVNFYYGKDQEGR